MEIALRKKVVLTTVFFLIWTSGFMMFYLTTFQLGFMSQLKGYVDYCYSIRLPYILEIVLGEIILTTILCSLYVYAELVGLKKRMLKCILIVAILNLGFMMYQVVQYPLLLHVFLGWGNNPDRVEAINHPLFYISFCFTFITILLTYGSRKIITPPSFTRLSYIVSTSILVIEIVCCLNIEYKMCIG